VKAQEIDLAPSDLDLVKRLLNEYVPQYEVRAFGSRVTKTAKKFSDLDLVIITTNPLPLAVLADLVDAFSNSKLPIKVDVLDWSRISENFQRLILNRYLTIQEQGSRSGGC